MTKNTTKADPNSLSNPKVMDQVKQFLGVISGIILILIASSGWLSTFAKADVVKAELEKTNAAIVAQAKVHSKDTLALQQAIAQNEVNRKKDYQQAKIEALTEKIQEINLKPRKTEHDKNLLRFYDVKKKDTQIRLESL